MRKKMQEKTTELKSLELFEAILRLKDVESCEAFLKDLCTPTELKAMKERWLVTQLLDSGNLSYRQIHDKTGVSIATITRVARFLFHENYAGYRKVLEDYFLESSKNSDASNDDDESN